MGHFASPVAEDKTSDAMEGVSDPQLSPENLRHQPDDPSSLFRSHDEEISRQHLAGPGPENISISEEVRQEKQDTTPKSRLRLSSSEPCILRVSKEEPISENFINSEDAKKARLTKQLEAITISQRPRKYKPLYNQRFYS